MKHRILSLALVVVSGFLAACAKPGGDSGQEVRWATPPCHETPERFLGMAVDNYLIVGSGKDGKTPYVGHATVEQRGGKTLVSRTINGQTSTGILTASAGPENILSLEMKLTEGASRDKGFFELHYDYENYALISGFISTKSSNPGAGWESWHVAPRH